MIRRYLILLTFVLSLIGKVQGGDISGSRSQKAPVDSIQFHGYQQGFNMKLWMGNNGIMGLNFANTQTTPSGYGLEYPIGSGIEHLFGAGLWIGASIDTSSSDTVKRVKSVTTAYDGSGVFEMSGMSDGRDSFYVTSIDEPNGHNRRSLDDDGDGRIDEDELDGIDNDIDGLIDEDYGAVSENDVSVAYYDMYASNNTHESHVPLGIKVWQRSFAWEKRVPQPILPVEFYIMNVGTKILDSVYLGFYADPDVGPKSITDYFKRNNGGYNSYLRTAVVYSKIDSSSNFLGLTLLGASGPFSSMFPRSLVLPGSYFPASDRNRYVFMSEAIATPDEYLPYYDAHVLIAFGPYFNFKPGDTLKVSVAFVSAEKMNEGPDNLFQNAARALEFHKRKFTTHPIPPPPPLRITKGFNNVTLDWQWREGDPGTDPIETWDDADPFLDTLPSTHWRKINPPAGHTTGGRVFEAFRVWRSDSPTLKPNSFGLLKQFDVADDLNEEHQTGLKFTLVDSGLNPLRSYWYAVTSVSIPEVTEVKIPNSIGGTDTMMLTLSPALESEIMKNATLVTLSNTFQLYQSYPNPFNPSTTIVYEIPERNRVVLTVYDVLGKEVARLVDDFKSPGRYEASWNSQGFASGVYFYRVKAGSFTDVKKMLLIR